MFRLDDKIALVTGGSRGIGRAIAIAFGEAGAHVIVNYRSGEAEAASVVEAITSAGGKAEALQFDVANAEQVDDVISEASKRLGGVHILVNNAGIALDQLLMRVKPEEIERTFNVNVAGAILCSKAVIRPMMKARFGRIINLSSVVGESGNPGQAVYSASKAALIGLTKTLAREYASRGVTVNAIAPGFIATEMTDALPEKAKEGIVSQTPVGRIGTPEDIAAAALYLASESASFVTGQCLGVNGGMHM